MSYERDCIARKTAELIHIPLRMSSLYHLLPLGLVTGESKSSNWREKWRAKNREKRTIKLNSNPGSAAMASNYEFGQEGAETTSPRNHLVPVHLLIGI
jgi:hypothetical protein